MCLKDGAVGWMNRNTWNAEKQLELLKDMIYNADFVVAPKGAKCYYCDEPAFGMYWSKYKDPMWYMCYNQLLDSYVSQQAN